jgi:HipA-like protein
MLSGLKKVWKKYMGWEGRAPLLTDAIELHLRFGQVCVGKLTLRGGMWEFSYSDAYQNRHDLRPLAQFPDKNRVYQSDELWPFFGLRIPSLKQPAVVRIIQEEKIDASDRVALLRRFGRRTVANPFELVG